MTSTAEYPELADRFRPVFAKIAEGALERETERRLPYDQVSWLREAGFGHSGRTRPP